MTRQAFLRTAAYAALFICFTLLFTVVNYPSERLVGVVNGYFLEASKGTLTAGSARFRLPLSLDVGGISLKLDDGMVEVGRAVVGLRPLSFLSGKKGADVDLDNPWLDSSLSIVSSGEGWDLDVRSMEIDLSRLPEEFMTLPVLLDGKVEVIMNLHSVGPSQDISSGDIRVTSGSIELGGDLLETLGLAPFKVNRVSAVATVKDNVVTLGENAIDGDLNAVARGVIRLTPADYTASRLDLTVELSPDTGKRERLTPIFALLGARPRADGSINIRVRGTIGKPSITM